MKARIKSYIDGIAYFRPFGLKMVWNLVFKCRRLPYGIRVAHEMSYKYEFLKRKFKNIDISDTLVPEDNNGPLWFCWWQGREAMPEIVAACYRQLCKNKPVGRDIVFIEESNYKDYVSLDPIILDKFNKGVISITHLSDILRANLLYSYGGIWVDATILCPSGLDDDLLNKPFFSISVPDKTQYISKGLWCGFLMGGCAGNPVFKFLSDCFNDYWNKYDRLVDYYMIDYIIAIAFERDISVRKSISGNSLSLPELYALQHSLNATFDEHHKDILTKNPFHKLTWKGEFVASLQSEKKTVREYIISL